MGIGDAIMTSATIRKAHAKHPDRPICVGPGATCIWSEVWENLPVSRTIKPDAVWIHDYGKHRPYIDYDKSDADHFHYRPEFKAKPGWIVLGDDERSQDIPRGFVYIEPNVKGSFASNKDWGFLNWHAVVESLSDVRFIQGRGNKLLGAEQIDTRNFRMALALLANASLFVGTDGALHHAAAALGIPAVVVWGGLASPVNLGYETHTNLWSGSKPCGSQKRCEHCMAALAAIKPAMVVEAIEEALACA